jgi:hypothetical protein
VYRENDINGLIACGSLRSFFPNGFAYYVFARKQYDASVTYEALLEDYYFHAYAENWRKFADYLGELGDAIGFAYLEGEESVDESRGKYYNPERANKLRGVPEIVKKGREIIEENYNFPIRVRTASVRVLEYHAEYAERLAKALAFKADGKDAEASEIMKTEVFPLVCENECRFATNFDTELFIEHIINKIGAAPTT